MLDVETLRSFGPGGMISAVWFVEMIPGLPTQPAAITTGALYGFQEGLACVCTGQALATASTIALARSPLARSMMDKAESVLAAPGPLKKSLTAVAEKINSQSALNVFGTVIGVRQSPVIPFSIGNYYLGLFTKAPIGIIVAGTVVGCFPLNALWVYVGATTSGALSAILAGEQVDVSAALSSPAGTTLEALGGLATAALAVVLYNTWKSAQQDKED